MSPCRRPTIIAPAFWRCTLTEAVAYPPEQIDDIRARWASDDPAIREQVLNELLTGIAKPRPENVRLEVVVPDTPEQRNIRDDLACQKYPTTDIGNSQRFARRKKSIAQYCHAYKSWFIWDGRRWCKDHTGKIIELAKDVILRIADEAGTLEFSHEQAGLFKWVAASQARPRIDAALYLAQSKISIEPKDLDARPHLLNLPNGTLDLQTGELFEHQKKDYLTKIAGVEYKPGEKCPQWLAHLYLIFNGDLELIDAFQQICGYTLLQDNPEQVMFILYGSGKNGKSKTIEVLFHILGEYAINIAAESLMSKRFNEGRDRILRGSPTQGWSALRKGNPGAVSQKAWSRA